MTLLNWELSPERLLLFSDTLSLDGETKLPHLFTSKIYPALHLGGLVAGTGVGPLLTSFYVRAIGDVVAEDTVHLSEFAPDILRRLWADYDGQLPAGVTSTIYTFGIDRSEGHLAGFAYRSASDFVAEPLGYGMASKPAVSLDRMAEVNDLAGFISLARDQQATDRSRPVPERIGIGGELWLHVLTKAEAFSTVAYEAHCLGPLLHVDSDRELILAGLDVNRDHPLSRALRDNELRSYQPPFEGAE